MNFENKVELRPHMAIDYTGKTVELGQWRVFVNEKMVGYLLHEPGARLTPIVNMPEDHWKLIVDECERIKKGPVAKPIPFYEAPVVVEEDDSEEDEE